MQSPPEEVKLSRRQ